MRASLLFFFLLLKLCLVLPPSQYIRFSLHLPCHFTVLVNLLDFVDYASLSDSFCLSFAREQSYMESVVTFLQDVVPQVSMVNLGRN